jgi:hypothetical protein
VSFVKKKSEKIMKKFCPTCGSIHIKSSSLILDNVLADFKFHECGNCSWRGVPLEGTSTFIQAFLESKRKKKGKEKHLEELEEQFLESEKQRLSDDE